MKGKVKWFNAEKGYGFIAPDGGGKDLFVHHSDIEMSGFRELETAQEVEFETATGPKGLKSVHVKPGAITIH